MCHFLCSAAFMPPHRQLWPAKYDFQNRSHAPMEKSCDNTASKYLEFPSQKSFAAPMISTTVIMNTMPVLFMVDKTWFAADRYKAKAA